MKSLKTIQTLSKIGKVLSKIAFVFSVVGFCGCIAGLISLFLGNGSLIKIGGVTLHSLIPENRGYNMKSISATLSGWMIVCVGEAVVAKFAEIYFKHELKEGKPFTSIGAQELKRLGILTIAVSALIFISISIFSDTQSEWILPAGLFCCALSNLFNLIRSMLVKNK